MFILKFALTDRVGKTSEWMGRELQGMSRHVCN